MTYEKERRALQAVVAVACLSPLGFGVSGVIDGPAMLAGVDPGDAAPDLVNHYRFLSGLFFMLGLVLLSCLPAIEKRTTRFRWAGAAIIGGGAARLFGLLAGDAPSSAHLIGLAAELGLTPMLIVWQGNLAGRYRAGAKRDDA